jgi:hypothetical protein
MPINWVPRPLVKEMRMAVQRDRAAHYRVLAKEATTEIMRERLLDLARRCDAMPARDRVTSVKVV